MTTYPEPTLIFENPELTVRALSVSEMDNSVYLITMRATGEQVLIDPATEAEELYAFTLDALLKDCPQLELTDSEDRRASSTVFLRYLVSVSLPQGCPHG